MFLYRRAALISLAFMHIRWSYGYFSHQDWGLVHCTVRRFVFPEEVIVIGSIASGWSGHVLCMDHCPMALGLLRNVICSAARRRHGMDGWRLVNMYNRPGFLAGERLGMERQSTCMRNESKIPIPKNKFTDPLPFPTCSETCQTVNWTSSDPN
jgi:hypothetical protein